MAREMVQVHGLAGVLDTLKRLPPEIVSRRGGPVKTALRKAAQVIQKEAQENVQRIIDTPNIDGAPTESIGLLKKSIIVSRDPRPQANGANERYLVRVKGKRYPADRGSPTTKAVGRHLEYGTAEMNPHPWLRPAFLTKKGQAVDTFVREIRKGIDKVVKKLAKRGR